MDITALIDALANPAAYAFSVREVEVRQTHISAVFLAGPYAYKIKKPIHLPFLDFGTLGKRRHFCEEEVRLNRRLAPAVYLGVVPVVRTGDRVRLECEGEIVEWAVKMQRLPDAATLEQRLECGEVDMALVEKVADRIATFHRTAQANAALAADDGFEAAARVIRDILDEAAPQVGATVNPAVFARVRTSTEQALIRLRSLIEERAAHGMTRDCHGDLHLDHVYFFPDREPPADLVIIDCIEFNASFRFIDPVADMAFPAMDLAFCGRRDLARAFADAYFRFAGDEEGHALLPLYIAYRAMVRGTVEGLLVAEAEVPATERDAAQRRARAHWLLALTELESPERRPCLLLIGGLPGAGKSRLAGELAERAGFTVIRSDVMRKRLAGRPADEESPPQRRDWLYSSDWTDRTYAECLRRAEWLLSAGKRVLVDATFREEQKRRTFLDAATRWGVPGGMLLCQAKDATVRQRLAVRQADASDADWAVYLEVAERWQDLGPATRRVAHVVDTNQSIEQSLSWALDALHCLGVVE